MDIKKTTIGIFALTMITFAAQESRAERIRTCDFVMTDTVTLLDNRLNVVGSFSETMAGTTAGRHGGIQANTARGRARDRFNGCRESWIFGSSKGSKQPSLINACRNSNVGSDASNDVFQLSGNQTYNDYIANVFRPEVCAFVQEQGLDANVLLLVLTGNSSSTTGGNRCGSSRDNSFGRFGRFVATIADLCS